MQSNDLGFHHPAALWVGCAAITLGVLAHLPMFVHASHMGYQMAGMEMDATMLAGMGLIPFGLLLAAWGMLPRLPAAWNGSGTAGAPLLFHVADAAQTIAAFVLRAHRIATVPLVVYVVAIWVIGLGGGYVAVFVLDAGPDWMRGAQGFWSMATLGVALAAVCLAGFLGWTLRRERAEAAALRSPAT